MTATEWTRGGYTKTALIARAAVLTGPHATNRQVRFFAAHLALLFHSKTLCRYTNPADLAAVSFKCALLDNGWRLA